MIRGYTALTQALLGSFFTWGLTALGSASVALISAQNKQLLDVSLGFAAGVMTAASFWSLLAPAIEITKVQFKSWAFLPVGFGFLCGSAFVYFADKILPYLGINCEPDVVGMLNINGFSEPIEESLILSEETTCEEGSAVNNSAGDDPLVDTNSNNVEVRDEDLEQRRNHQLAVSWKRIFLLILAITVHNIPEGLAVGVGFGAIGKSQSATFESACSLALGIGIQNFPEGLAVSLPLAGFGYSKWNSFWYGQLSGMVEPFAAVSGAVAVSFMEPVLPYALSFAAGAMIYVVFDDIIPEAQVHGNGRLASWGGVAGFLVMMALDVGLG